jgi:predicted methyltransferase
MKHLCLAAAALAALVACTPALKAAPAPAAPEVPAAPVLLSPLEIAIAGDWRPAADTARDVWRHPKETLEFFGVQPNHKVVEVWPGGGWYTQILGPYLATGGGTLVAAGFDVASVTDNPERKARLETRLAEFKTTYGDPRYGTIAYSAFSGASGPLTEAASADVVLSFRNVHNWMASEYADKFFTDAFAALKPGGTLGIVEHRLPSTATQDPKALTGYVHEDYVKALALAAGFEFVEASEINANPADTADHPFGVWTLPPNSTVADDEGKAPEGFDPAKYQAIGESDRMTLKFRKPE